MKSVVFVLSAFLVMSCQALTPVGPDGPVGPIIDPKIPGLIEKFPFPNPVDRIRPVCGQVCAIWCPNGNIMDSRGCPTCKCKPTNCMKARSCYFCPYGRTFFTDGDGCRTCKCKPRPGPVCPVYVRDPCQGVNCPNGFQKDSNGCPTCNCKPAPIDICPPLDCFIRCRNGYRTDSNGCKICSCNSGVTATCTYDGKTYSNGQNFKKDCNDCFCLNGRTLCTERACSIGSCRDGGKVYKNGESYKKDCNSCFCRNGRSLCTLRACLVGFDRTRLEA